MSTACSDRAWTCGSRRRCERWRATKRSPCAPGESRRITIPVDPARLRYWNTAANGWVTGTGTRTVYLGQSSADLPLHADVTIR
ncbi:fibronectin type III-like domain-contianing protein [Amycolatopsis saalfeldensis]|uniref:fibronectin type III-like domain-contianing protein n=1 Tax=Amycolatopsis saalfeldensis TaxID=394193 RepID=UPI000B805DDD